MNEETQTQPQSEPSLDDVYKQFNVQEAAESFTAKPQAQPAPQQQPAVIPDPALDIDGFKTWARQQSSADSELRQTLTQVNERLSGYEQERQRTREEADLHKAVSVLKEKVPGADDEFLEIALAHKARKDPKLLSIWENRAKNPQALEAALKAVGNEFASKFSLKADPQLAENTRAMKASRDQKATTQAPDVDEKWRNPDNFEREWARLVES
jgi:hypothetical protein